MRGGLLLLALASVVAAGGVAPVPMDFGRGDAIPLHNRAINSVKSVAGAAFYKSKQLVDNLRPEHMQRPTLHGPMSFNDIRHVGKRALDNKTRKQIADKMGRTANLADVGYRSRVAVYKDLQKRDPSWVSGRMQMPEQNLVYEPTTKPGLMSGNPPPPLPFGK